MAARTTSSTTGGNFNSGASRAVGSEYVYDNGDSENDFIRRNAFGRETGYGFTNFANPVGGAINAIKGKRAYKKARAAYERQVAARDAQARATDYAGKMTELNQIQGREDQTRNTALSAIDAPGAIANDNAEIERGYQADIGNSFAGLSEDLNRSSQRQGLAAARRGIQGGSNDMEQQADLGAGFQSNLIDANQKALSRSANDTSARANSRSELRRSILTDDPAQAASWTERSRAEDTANERDSRMTDYYNAFNQLHQQQAETNSRLIGGAASAFADSYRTDQQARGDGRAGLY